MESMRDVLRRNLGRSLQGLSVLDRLTAAWPVACGATMATRGQIVEFRDGILHVEVQDSVWLDQMRSMRAILEREVTRIAGVEVAAIHFQVRAPGPKGLRR